MKSNLKYKKINHNRFEIVYDAKEVGSFNIGSIIRNNKDDKYMLMIEYKSAFLITSGELKHIAEQIEFLNAKPKDNEQD